MQSFTDEILQFSMTLLLRSSFLNDDKFVIVSKPFWAQGSEMVSNCRLIVSDFHQSTISGPISEGTS